MGIAVATEMICLGGRLAICVSISMVTYLMHNSGATNTMNIDASSNGDGSYHTIGVRSVNICRDLASCDERGSRADVYHKLKHTTNSHIEYDTVDPAELLINTRTRQEDNGYVAHSITSKCNIGPTDTIDAIIDTVDRNTNSSLSTNIGHPMSQGSDDMHQNIIGKGFTCTNIDIIDDSNVKQCNNQNECCTTTNVHNEISFDDDGTKNYTMGHISRNKRTRINLILSTMLRLVNRLDLST